MKETIKDLQDFFTKDWVKTSVVITAINGFILSLSLIFGRAFHEKELESISLASIIISLIYGLIAFIRIINKREVSHIIPFLYINWFIGCFSTNVFINIFENLPIWAYVITFLFCFSCFAIYNRLKNDLFLKICYLLNGISTVLILYYTVYLVPFTPISVVGILALGIGFYGLVPAITIILHTINLIKTTNFNFKNRLIFFSGILLVFISIILFTVKINSETKKMNGFLVTKTFNTGVDVPNYITISQHLNASFINEIILKKGLVYIFTDNFFSWDRFDPFDGQQFNERKVHNPFINVAFFFSDDLVLSEDDRINILKSNFDKRLETEEQLWSGEGLITKNIREDIKIFSKERLAYTEITIDVASKKEGWASNEAIYSFQLPEGAVATSLSLWVNGIERKGVLTTKEKAETAYKQIVGVEMRDPSIMQWREGNRVVVRVFPISFEMPRTFKCGFTTPLKANEKTLDYESLSIKGPNLSNAETLSRIQIIGNDKYESTKDFELKNGFFINESKGFDDWKISILNNNKIEKSAFIWKNFKYEIKPLEKLKINFKPSELVLDLNSAWEIDEIESLLKNTKATYFVFSNEQKQEINKTNYKVIFENFSDLQYSLLPLYNIKNNSLVITKSGSFSANFEELENSKFLTKTKELVKAKNIKVISISDNINPYWQTIKEQKYVDYIETSIKNCQELINKNQFIINKKADNLVAIEPANIEIEATEISQKETVSGSNHIYRMFAFGKVMAEHIASKEDISANNNYVQIAKEANIVTPVSSLIVLETDADYEKNGIEKNVDTLGNASISNHGAVPEPYEWALIIMLILSLLFYYKKQIKFQ